MVFKIIVASAFILLSNYLFAQKPTFYKTANGRLYTPAQMDSTVAEINKRNPKLKAEVVVSDRRVNADTVFLFFYYNMTNEDDVADVDSASVMNNQKLKSFIGNPLPGFKFKDVNGKMVKSKKLKGKPVVINLWFTTCLPCIAEMPELNRIQAIYKDSGIIFLSMTFDSREKVLQFLKKRQFNFRAISDVSSYIERITSLFPVTLFIKRNGLVNNIAGGMPILSDSGTIDNKEYKVDPREFLSNLIQIYR